MVFSTSTPKVRWRDNLVDLEKNIAEICAHSRYQRVDKAEHEPSKVSPTWASRMAVPRANHPSALVFFGRRKVFALLL